MNVETRRALFLALSLVVPACKKDERAVADDRPRKPATVTSNDGPLAEAPMVTSAPSSGATIAAPPDVTLPPRDAIRSSDGLASKVLLPGSGTKHPGPDDTVKVNYTGWTTDGKMFDSSVTRSTPASFPLNGVIKGWTEGLQLMVVGEERRFWIPEALAYGGKPGRPQGMLVFDVQLLELKEAPKPIVAPADVGAPNPLSKVEKSGLATMVLTPGTGTKHPGPTSTVKVDYTGWTTDGKMFDSSVVRGEPVSFPLNGVIAGWTEGVQLMVEGEKRRLWIPEALAYKGSAGAPKGMLVFDVELLKIEKP